MERSLVGQGGATEPELQTKEGVSKGLKKLIAREQNEMIR